MSHEAIAVFLGLDVGKGAHYAVALDRSGSQLLSRALPQDETSLRRLLEELRQTGPVLLVVDQPATIGALPVAVAQEIGIAVGYLPGLTVKRMADVFPGEAKTDARDALVIAQTARVLPERVRSLAVADEQVADLTMLCGYDVDLVRASTAVVNQLRGLLTQLHPALERVLGPRLDRHGVVELLQKWPTPPDLRAAGEGRIATLLKRHGSRQASRLAAAIVQALREQTVSVVGTTAAAQIIPNHAAHLLLLRRQRADIATQVETLVQAHPLWPVLTSLDGVGVRTAATLIVTLHGKTFASAAHLASYAGIAPRTRRSGSSIHSEHAARGGNKVLKNALFQSAFASLKHPPSRAYYLKKKQIEGKTHRQAVMALARRRIDVLYAMMRDGTTYRPPPT